MSVSVNDRINFNNPTLSKPGNLQNSAVLRMLEEEEQRQRTGQYPSDEHNSRPLRDQINWPPAGNDDKRSRSYKDVVTPGLKRVAWPPPREGEDYIDGPAQQPQGGSPAFQNNYAASPQQQPQSPIYQRGPQSPAAFQSPVSFKPASSSVYQPIPSSPGYQQQRPLSPLVLNQSPSGYISPTVGSKGWAPVHSPVLTPTQPKLSPVFQKNQQYQTSNQQYFQAAGPVSPQQQQYQSPQYQQQAPQYQQQPSQYQQQASQYQQQPPQYQQQAAQYQQSPQYQQQAPQYQQSPQYQQQAPQYQQSPQYQQQAPQYQQQPSPYQQPQHITPAPTQTYQSPNTQQNQYQQPAAVNQVGQQNQQYQPQQTQAFKAVAPLEPPPSTITLRPKAPVSQAPPPVFNSQPATATLKGGKHLRGDLKWPPENVRQRMADDLRHLEELAKGPAIRPLRPNKDYSQFFAKHALNSAYPGYKIPPGTQFYLQE